MKKNKYFDDPVVRLKLGDDMYTSEKPITRVREMLTYDEATFLMPDKRVSCDLRKGITWQILLEQGILKHDYDYQKTEMLLTELCSSTVEVPTEVLMVVYQDGIANKRYRNLNRFLSLCNNRSSLTFLLERGAKFKKIIGCGNSTMEKYIIYCEFLDILKQYPNALDMKWVKKNKVNVAGCVANLIERNETEGALFLISLLSKC